MSSGESFIEIKIDKNGKYKVFGPDGEELNLIDPVKVEEILDKSSEIKWKFSNGIATYLETNSGLIWINGKPYWIP